MYANASVEITMEEKHSIFCAWFQSFIHNRYKKGDAKKLNRVFSHPLLFLFYPLYTLYITQVYHFEPLSYFSWNLVILSEKVPVSIWTLSSASILADWFTKSSRTTHTDIFLLGAKNFITSILNPDSLSNPEFQNHHLLFFI